MSIVRYKVSYMITITLLTNWFLMKFSLLQDLILTGNASVNILTYATLCLNMNFIVLKNRVSRKYRLKLRIGSEAIPAHCSFFV